MADTKSASRVCLLTFVAVHAAIFSVFYVQLQWRAPLQEVIEDPYHSGHVGLLIISCFRPRPEAGNDLAAPGNACIDGLSRSTAGDAAPALAA